MLELKHIFKEYIKSAPVLRDVCLSFRSKGLSLLVGPSGSGKTTLLNIIGGMDVPTAGSVSFDRKEIKKRNIDSYRNSEVGFVLQDMNLIPSFTLGENLRFAFDLCHRKMTDEDVTALLDSVGLPDDVMDLNEFLRRKPYELSIGQMQRFAIARSLVKNPRILLLDEPTSALDEDNANKIVSLLKELSRDRTIIVSSHDKALFMDTADQVVKIENGVAALLKKYAPREEQFDKVESKPRLGFFSFAETLRIALFNLKNKKIRLASSLIVTTIVAALFGVACLLQTFDKTDVLLRPQIEGGMNGAFLTRMQSFYSHNSYFEQQRKVEFNDDQIMEIDGYTGGAYAPVWIFGSDSPSKTIPLGNAIGIIDFYTTMADYQYVEIGLDIDVEDIGLLRYDALAEDTTCRLPKTVDEVAISSLYAELMLRYGFMEKNEQTTPELTHVDRIDDLIGHKLSNGLTIVGIFSTDDGACEFLEPFLGVSSEELECREDYEKINSIRNGASLAQYMYVAEGYHEETFDGLGIYTHRPSTVYVRLKGDYSADRAFLSSFEKNSYFLDFSNYYSGFIGVVPSFSGMFRLISWGVIVILLIVSFATTLGLFYGNVKSMEHDLGIFKSMGASKWSISLIVLAQSFIIGLVEFVVSLSALGIFSAVVNAKVSISLFSVNVPTVLLLFLVLVIIALLVSLLSARRAILNRPTNVMKNV